MSDRERRIAVLMAEAGIRSVADLHRLIEARHPGIATAPTVWSYLYTPPRRLDAHLIFAIAEAWGVDPMVAKEALERDSATAR